LIQNIARSLMKPLVLLILSFCSFVSLRLNAQNTSDEILLNQMLHNFMEGASNNDSLIHANFWADDLIYTSSIGKRFGKKEIMSGFNKKNTPAENPSTVYTAEDIIIQQYNDMAIVAFKMKAVNDSSVQYYLNSGTFLKRQGKWQVVNWQATLSTESTKK
jgi:ketosteroid isomerase-like protein